MQITEGLDLDSGNSYMCLIFVHVEWQALKIK